MFGYIEGASYLVAVMDKIPLSPEWRRALRMLSDAGEIGSTEAVLIAHGFSPEMLTSLVRTGFAIMTTAERIRITDVGARALQASRPKLSPQPRHWASDEASLVPPNEPGCTAVGDATPKNP